MGWEEGSAIATFELCPQPQQMDMFGSVGEASLKAFLVDGMEVIAADADGENRLPTGYDSGVLEAVEAWMKNVKITGKINEGKHLIEVEAMLVIEDEMMQTDTQTEARSFWQSVSLDDLAEEQGIGATADLDSIAAAWPTDDDPDGLLDFVLHERGQRRRAAEQIT